MCGKINYSPSARQFPPGARSHCVAPAYFMPDVNPAPHRGRPRKKGDSVKLNTLFQSRASQFIKADTWMYGKRNPLNICAWISSGG